MQPLKGYGFFLTLSGLCIFLSLVDSQEHIGHSNQRHNAPKTEKKNVFHFVSAYDQSLKSKYDSRWPLASEWTIEISKINECETVLKLYVKVLYF